MIPFVLKRLALLVPILLAVSFVVFAILRLGPVDPVTAYLYHSSIPPTPELVALTRADFGLDKPFLTQYVIWLGNALHLDFGLSYVTKKDALDSLLYYFPTTLKLAGLSMLLVIMVSLPLGIVAGLKRNRAADKIIQFFSFLGVSTPNFLIGLILMYVFSLKLKILPPFGDSGPLSLIMPVLTLSIMSMAINTRLMRTSFLEHINQNCVFFMRVAGMSERKLIGKYTLKNSLIPVVTMLGMHFGVLLGGAVVIESLFALPGVGRYITGAIHNHDFPVIQCFMMIITMIFVFLNLATDILYMYLNPKIRFGDD